MILYLIRHGQSANNLMGESVLTDKGEFDEDAYKHYMASRVADPPLTDAGQKQAERLADFLRQARPKHRPVHDDPPEAELRGTDVVNRLGISRIYCSPMLRTQKTFSGNGTGGNNWSGASIHESAPNSSIRGNACGPKPNNSNSTGGDSITSRSGQTFPS